MINSKSTKSRERYLLKFFISGFVITVTVIALILFTDIPLGVPDDWQWMRLKHPHIPLVETSMAAGLFCFSLLLSLFVDCKLAKIKYKLKLFLSLLIIMLTLPFNYYILHSGRAGILENVIAVTDHWSTGYLSQASKIKHFKMFLQNYNKILSIDADESNHTDVHPPGNTAFSFFMIQVAKFVIPLPVYEWEKLHVKKVVNFSGSYSKEAIISDQLYVDAAFLIVFIFLASISASNFILFFAIRNLSNGMDAPGLIALSFFAVPAPVLFLGLYDTLYYFLTSITCLLFSYFIKFSKKKSQKRYCYTILTSMGIWLGFCTLFSIGFFVVLFMILIFLFVNLKLKTNKRLISEISCLLVGFIFFIGLVYCVNIKLIDIYYFCSRNNSRFFEQNKRSLIWIIVNYLDYALFVGGISISAIFYYLRQFTWKKKSYIIDFTLAYTITLIIVSATGFSRGEMGRLLLLFIPFNTVIAGYMLNTSNKPGIIYVLKLLTLFALLWQIIIIRSYLKIVLYF